jgi:broad specificity phosphatase PhoE
LSVWNRSDVTWRYKDGESFPDIYARVQRAFEYIESLADDHASVVIVSHTIFINFMVTYMCHGRMLTLRELLVSFFHVEQLKNCNVIELKYLGTRKKNTNTCNWARVV